MCDLNCTSIENFLNSYTVVAGIESACRNEFDICLLLAMSAGATAADTGKALLRGMSSMFQFAAEQTSKGVKSLTSVPTEVSCIQCNAICPVPHSTFDWECGFCGIVNAVEASNCSNCSSVRGTSSRKYSVLCVMCGATNDVPTSVGMKHLISVKRTTVSLASKGAELAKKTYEKQTSAPERFHCDHCATLLDNPNVIVTPAGEESKEPVVTLRGGEYIQKMACPICKLITSIPKAAAVDNLGSLGSTISKGITKAVYSVTSGAADCPTCRAPVKLPPKESISSADKTRDVASVRLTCPKCMTEFPVTY